MYLFDTDTMSNVVKRKPSVRLLQKLEETPIAFQHTSAINVGANLLRRQQEFEKNAAIEGL